MDFGGVAAGAILLTSLFYSGPEKWVLSAALLAALAAFSFDDKIADFFVPIRQRKTALWVIRIIAGGLVLVSAVRMIFRVLLGIWGQAEAMIE